MSTSTRPRSRFRNDAGTRRGGLPVAPSPSSADQSSPHRSPPAAHPYASPPRRSAARSMARKRLTTARPMAVSCAPAALAPSGLRGDKWLAEHPVHVLDQIPGMLIGHLHAARGGRDRAECGDVLQKFDLARTDPPVGIESYPQAQRRQSFLLPACPSESSAKPLVQNNLAAIATPVSHRPRAGRPAPVLARSKLAVLTTAKTLPPSRSFSACRDCSVMRASTVTPWQSDADPRRPFARADRNDRAGQDVQRAEPCRLFRGDHHIAGANAYPHRSSGLQFQGAARGFRRRPSRARSCRTPRRGAAPSYPAPRRPRRALPPATNRAIASPPRSGHRQRACLAPASPRRSPAAPPRRPNG